MITKIDSLAIDNPGGKNRTLELWYGDIEKPLGGGIASTEFVVMSRNPSSTKVCPSSVEGAFHSIGLDVNALPVAANYQPNMPTQVSGPISGIAGYRYVLEFSPSKKGLTVSQVAPHLADSIFKSIYRFKKSAPTSVTLPMVSCGSKTGAGRADPETMLRVLFHSAVKWGGVNDFDLTTVRIVLHSRDRSLINVFTEIKNQYLKLMNSGFAAMPDSHLKPYPHYATETRNWMKVTLARAGGKWPDLVTDLQAFAIHMYTTSYFHAMNDTLRLPAKSITPSTRNLPFTDLTNPVFHQLQPLYSAMSAGLLNLSAYKGTTYRGVDSFWFDLSGKKVRILSYMSSTDQSGWSSCGNPAHKHPNLIVTNSLTSRDISFYSKHPGEREHVYDIGFEESIDGHWNARPIPPPVCGKSTTKPTVATSEIAGS